MKKNDDVQQQEEIVAEAAEEKVSDEVATLQEQIEDLENRYKRVLADYQNLTKRSQEERSEWIRSGNREILLRLLPVLDTLVMASLHSDDQTIQVSIKQFLDALKQEGVEKIETVGKVFDPHLMEVITVQEGEDNKVVQEVRSGYLLNDKLLRPAQVIVGKKSV